MGTLLGIMVVALIVLALIAGYLLVRAVNLILRVLARYPRSSRPLWLVLAICLLSVAGAIAFQAAPLAMVAAGSFLVALLVARAIELAHSEAFEEPASFQLLAQDVLHDWWRDVA